ncbi:hypothetical protein J4217_03775 [Candidatus Pacearchaeota archaeon]|nr:hypothetical protein [uncultured archaeon]AQS33241.1 hypothetical protein [uncultured archaeon]MBS3091538.1 hypothetical protein [Candidatus Pacearchaeota archaeon]
MESFIKKILTGKGDEDSHKYLIRFGKGAYNRRFLISYAKSADKIKIKTSFEFANDLVKFIRENKDVKFSGKVLSKQQVSGMSGRKKAGVYLYEMTDSDLRGFDNPYYFLLDANDSDIVLKMKKSLPKPGKNSEKIDDGFCSLIISNKYWQKVKETFFWDVPDGKKAEIEHKLDIKEIILPKNEKDSVKIRENSLRKGAITRKINVDGKEESKNINFEA